MGNRAVLQFKENNNTLDTGIYLHWNGGRDTIEPLLEVAKEYQIRGGDYGIARLCQIIGNTFDGGLGLGIGHLEELDRDNCDNGTYVIDSGKWEIVDRLFKVNPEQKHWPFEEMKAHIKKANDKFYYDDDGKLKR